MEIEIGHYIINPQQQGSQNGKDYELHNADTCKHLPADIHQITLGHFTSCDLALEEAKRRYPEWAEQLDGCAWCCPRCHEG